MAALSRSTAGIKNFLLLSFLCAVVLSLQAAAPPRGADQLRELVVFPKIDLTFKFELNFFLNQYVLNVGKTPDPLTEIARLRAEVQSQPQDVDRLLRLGFYLAADGQTNDSQTCYRQVESLCRARLKSAPDDTAAWIVLGTVLHQMDRDQEAGTVYHKAVQVNTNDWKSWIALGNFLSGGLTGLFPKAIRDSSGGNQSLWEMATRSRPAADALAKTQDQFAEAARCYEKAAALAPGEPQVFIQSAGYLCASNGMSYLYHYYHDGGKMDQSELYLTAFSRAAIPDLLKASQLAPREYRYLSLSAYFVWANTFFDAPANNVTYDDLPSSSRQLIDDAITRLQKLSGDPDKATAAGALQNLGILKIMFGQDKIAAATDLQRSVNLNPTNDLSWDMLLASRIGTTTPEETTALCQARLKYKDSPWNHLLLARAYEYQKKWADAGREAQITLQMQPDNLVAHIQLIALALKQSTDPSFLTKAMEHFSRAAELYARIPEQATRVDRGRELNLDLAIYHGLVNTPESRIFAKQCVESVLQQNPNDQQARAIAAALD